jgi:hypothetical protein
VINLPRNDVTHAAALTDTSDASASVQQLPASALATGSAPGPEITSTHLIALAFAPAQINMVRTGCQNNATQLCDAAGVTLNGEADNVTEQV